MASCTDGATGDQLDNDEGVMRNFAVDPRGAALAEREADEDRARIHRDKAQAAKELGDTETARKEEWAAELVRPRSR